jgi:hypothetical protein
VLPLRLLATYHCCRRLALALLRLLRWLLFIRALLMLGTKK